MIHESPEAQDTIPTPTIGMILQEEFTGSTSGPTSRFAAANRKWSPNRPPLIGHSIRNDLNSPHRTPRPIQLGKLCKGDLKPPGGFRERRRRTPPGAPPNRRHGFADEGALRRYSGLRFDLPVLQLANQPRVEGGDVERAAAYGYAGWSLKPCSGA